MPIITISRGSYSKGKEVAEKVAQKLGYECIARDTILEASEQYNLPEVKLIRAIHDAPSILNRFTGQQEKYIAHIQAALVRHVQKDNVVYHGLAGHFLLKGITHVLKVRIIAEFEDRIRAEMERENISEKEARRILLKDDEQRRKWSKHLYGIDTSDPSLYDLVIHIKKITVDDAADIICDAVALKTFQTTAESNKAIDDLLLACDVKVALVDLIQDIEVRADNGVVYIETSTHASQEQKLARQIKEMAQNIEGVKEVQVNIGWISPYV